MRAGAWPQAAPSTSQLRISWAPLPPRAGQRRFAIGRARPNRGLAGRERVEELGIEVRGEPGLGGDDDARGGGARRPAIPTGPRARTSRGSGRHRSSDGASRERAARARVHQTRSPRRAYRCGPAHDRAARPSRRQRCKPGSGGAKVFTTSGTTGTSRSARRYWTAWVMPWSTVSRPENATSNSSSYNASSSITGERRVGRQGTLGCAVLAGGDDFAHAEHEGGHEVEPQSPEVVRSDDHGEVRPCRPQEFAGRSEAVAEHDARDRGGRPRPTCVFISVVCDAARPMTMLTELAPQSLVPTHVPVVRVSTCSSCLRKATARAATAPRTSSLRLTSRGPCRGMR